MLLIFMSLSLCPYIFPIPHIYLSMTVSPHISFSAYITLLFLTHTSHLGLPVPHNFLTPLCSPSLPFLLSGSKESQAFTIICGEPDITVVLAQCPVLPTLHVKPELLDTLTPSARDQERCYWTDDRRQRKRLIT